MTYITADPPVVKKAADGSDLTGHPFLDIPTMTDEDGLIVARGEHVYAVLNLYPYNPGHTMIVPYRQVADLEARPDRPDLCQGAARELSIRAGAR